MWNKYFFVVFFICFYNSLAAEGVPVINNGPLYTITISAPQGRYLDSMLAVMDDYWISGDELHINGWYYNQELNMFIPPYLDKCIVISPYDGGTAFYRSKGHLYFFTKDSYSKGLPPISSVPLPDMDKIKTPYYFFNQVLAAWISPDEILVIAVDDGLSPKRLNPPEWMNYVFYVYSISQNRWRLLSDKDMDNIRPDPINILRGRSNNQVFFSRALSYSPYFLHNLYIYNPQDGSLKDRFKDRHDSTFGGFYPTNMAVVPEEGYFVYSNVMDNNEVYCTYITADGICFVTEVFSRKEIKRWRLPPLNSFESYRDTMLSPDGKLLVVKKVGFKKDARGREITEPLEYLVFDAGSEESYTRKISININESFGFAIKKYETCRDIETIVSDLVASIPLESEIIRDRERLRSWLAFLNNIEISNNKKDVQLREWIIPQKGSLLYMLGAGSSTFSIVTE
jgi:hypothetical protein